MAIHLMLFEVKKVNHKVQPLILGQHISSYSASLKNKYNFGLKNKDLFLGVIKSLNLEWNNIHKTIVMIGSEEPLSHASFALDIMDGLETFVKPEKLHLEVIPPLPPATKHPKQNEFKDFHRQMLSKKTFPDLNNKERMKVAEKTTKILIGVLDWLMKSASKRATSHLLWE